MPSLPGAFEYALPPDRIAQHAAEPRDAARLMVVDRGREGFGHRRVRDLPELLEPGDLLVVNDTKVLPARLAARRKTGGLVEVVLVRPRPDGAWQAIVRSRGRLKAGEVLRVGEAGLRVEAHEGGDWALRIDGMDPAGLMAAHGKAPLPPYIRRPLEKDPDREEDLARYQTVFARAPGAVAAPTAGLHVTSALMARLKERSIGWASVTLHVGPGTFRTADGALPDPEFYEVPEETALAVQARKGRVVAVGTTAARALEAWAVKGERRGWTDLVISPGFRFRAVEALLTNFHLPRTSLLSLVCALAGRDKIEAAYTEALGEGYRFYSYGDAMLIL